MKRYYIKRINGGWMQCEGKDTYDAYHNIRTQHPNLHFDVNKIITYEDYLKYGLKYFE
jgi:hypothetical protein